MAFDQMNIKDCLCDMYDIRRVIKQAKLFDAPKDNDGTIFTIKDCFDNVIGQLEQELERRGQEI